MLALKKPVKVLSATQIELFRKCPRLWIERYIFGHRLPSTEAMNEGLEVHQAIEAYLKTGKLTEGRWKNVLRKLDETLRSLGLVESGKPVDGVLSEKQVRVKLGSVWFTGAMDIYDGRAEIPTILDLKSKNNLAYVLNEFQLAEDIQLSVYAWYVMDKLGVDQVHLKHIYVLRDEQNPDVKVVPITVTREQVLSVWEKLEATAEQMVALGETDLKSSLEAEGNEASCFKYGQPCHYLEQCERKSDLVGLRKKTDFQGDPVSSASLLEELKARKAAKAAAGVEKNPTPPTEKKQVETAATGEEEDDLSDVSLLPPGAPSRLTSLPEKEAPAPAPAPTTKKSKVKVLTTPQEVVASMAETMAESVGASTANLRVRVAASPRVYVGCLPVGREVANFSAWIAPIEEIVAKRLKLPHWRAAQFIAHGEAAMTIEIRVMFDDLPAEMFLSGAEPSAEVFLAAAAASGKVEIYRRCY